MRPSTIDGLNTFRSLSAPTPHAHRVPTEPSDATPQLSRRSFLAATAAIPMIATGAGSRGTPRATSRSVFTAHGPSASTHVALTFHGAGDPALTTKAAATLRRLNAPVTVFAVGTWVEANPGLIRTLAADGHELANHTYTHPALRRLNRAAVATEIAGCASALQHITGHIGTWFRPSGTPTPTNLMLDEAAKAGYPTVVGYDVDPLDYQDPGTALVVSRTLAGAHGGSIISLHLGHAGTVAALEPIINGLRKKGLQPATVTTVLAS